MNKLRVALIGLVLLVGLSAVSLANNNIIQGKIGATLLAAVHEVAPVVQPIVEPVDEPVVEPRDEPGDEPGDDINDHLEDAVDDVVDNEEDAAEDVADDVEDAAQDVIDEAEDENGDEKSDNRAHPLPPAGFKDRVLTKMPNNPFRDTNTDRLTGLAAGELYRRGVIGGYPDGEFKGHRKVNRAEASKFLLLARFEVVEETGEDVRFSDVIRGQWYVKYIKTAAEKGIISGHPDGTFRPANTVNTAEFLKMLSLTFDLELDLDYSYTDVDAEAWYAQYVGAAERYDLFPERTDEIQPAQPLTRNEVAVAIYQYLANR